MVTRKQFLILLLLVAMTCSRNLPVARVNASPSASASAATPRRHGAQQRRSRQQQPHPFFNARNTNNELQLQSSAPSSSSRTALSHPQYYADQTPQEEQPFHDSLVVGPPIKLLWALALVASGNIVLNILRPDPWVTFEMRLPRLLWELALIALALVGMAQPMALLVLALMTACTAMVDVFFWAPLLAFGVTWEECTGGGWFSSQPRVCTSSYTTGFSRLFASIQSMVGGTFYLVTAVTCWRTYWEIQQNRNLQKQQMVMQQAWQQPQGLQIQS